jgi:cell division protein FtsB
MDIKTIAGIISIAIAIGGLFVYQGQLIQRVEVLEKKESVDIKPLEQEISLLKREIAVLKRDIEQLKKKNNNPLMR